MAALKAAALLESGLASRPKAAALNDD